MENHLIQYSSAVENLFFNFLKEFIDLEEFTKKLEILERMHKKMLKEPDSEKELWFRLYEGYTGATSVTDLTQDLDPSCNTQSNIKHIKECMWIGISLGNQVQIYYS